MHDATVCEFFFVTINQEFTENTSVKYERKTKQILKKHKMKRTDRCFPLCS